jgi:hypothetical protein
MDAGEADGHQAKKSTYGGEKKAGEMRGNYSKKVNKLESNIFC